MRFVSAAAAVAAVALLAAGCSAQPEPAAESSPTASEPVATTPPSESTPSVPTAPAPTPTAESLATPQTCLDAGIAVGASVDGAALGACIADGLAAAGSGRMTLGGTLAQGAVDFAYSPAYAFHLAGAFDLWYVDGAFWVDQGAGPVAADPASPDEQERMAAQTAEYYRAFADPRAVADILAAGPEWLVDDEQTEDGGFRVTASEPFDWEGTRIAELAVELAPGLAPVGAELSLTVHGVDGTLTQTFEDLGEPVEITPPVAG
ncbi:hypothetical protein [Microbacterium gilvum]|uniref:LppX_LprAFG lipoprotein n=1 Tax=Microbacterium gilvum TaxID=1336204 RepID=A0ABP9A3K1_9MICO